MRNFIRNELPWLLLSLTFAVVLWLYFTGQNVQPRDIIAVPVFTETPRNLYVDRGELPSSLVITVEATAAQFQLIERGNSAKVTVAVDLTQIKAGPNEVPISLEGTVTPPLPRNIRNPKPSPATIKIEAVPIRRREVPVRPPDEAHVLATYLQPTGPWEITPPMALVDAPEDRITDIVDLSTRFVTPDRMISDVDNAQLLAPLVPPDSEDWLRVAPDRFTAHLPVEFRTKTMSFYKDVTLDMIDPAEAPGTLGPPDPVALDPPAVRVTLSFRADRPDDRVPAPADVRLVATVDPHDVMAGTPVYVDVTVASEIPGVAVAVEPAQVSAVRLTEESWAEITERRAAEDMEALTGSPSSPGPGGTVHVPGTEPGPPAPAEETPGDITRPSGPAADSAPPAAGSGTGGAGGSRAAAGSGASARTGGSVQSRRPAGTASPGSPAAPGSGTAAAGPPHAAAGASPGQSSASGGAGASDTSASAAPGSARAGGSARPSQTAPASPPAKSVPGAKGDPQRVESGEEAKVLTHSSEPAADRVQPRRGRTTGRAN
ncbi:MAG: hypothetical protein LBT40_17135 [Deltaproteobacteria bacterium]|nr:hypothetical protein [Deltaproteobacteria bacterium]